MKEIVDKLDFTEIESFCSTRHYRVNYKISHAVGEIFAEDIPGKGLLANYTKKSNLTIRKLINPIKN